MRRPVPSAPRAASPCGDRSVHAEGGIRSTTVRSVWPCRNAPGQPGGAPAGFLMDLMRTGAGYPWTVIPVEGRDTYMAALETASVGRNIGPFTDFLAGLVEGQGRGDP